jgi:hypothetical protein
MTNVFMALDCGAAGEDSRRAAAMAKVDVAAARAFAAEHMRGAVVTEKLGVTEKFGNVSFSLGGKVFAFTRPDGLVMKLPDEVIERVMAERMIEGCKAELLVMGKRTMREWVHMKLDGAEEYRTEVELMQVAMTFAFASIAADARK